MEPFDLALGLRVAGAAVLLGDAEQREQVLEGVAAATESGGVDAAVVGQRRGREPVLVGDGGGSVDDDQVAGDRGVGGAAEQVAGVVIEPVQDLDIGAIGERPVGEVGLPALVGLGRCEAAVGGPWSFAGLGNDEPGGVQDASDGRGRGRPVAFLVEVPRDGDRAGIEAGRWSAPGGAARIRYAQGDPGWPRVGRRGRRDRGSRASRPPSRYRARSRWRYCREYPYLAAAGGDGEFLGDDLQDDNPGFRHDRGLSPMSRLR